MYFIIAIDDPFNPGQSLAFHRQGSTKSMWGCLNDAKKFESDNEVLDFLKRTSVNGDWEVMLINGPDVAIWPRKLIEDIERYFSVPYF